MKTAGQTLTEFALLATVVFSMIGLTYEVFQKHWQRALCTYLVFETTHARRSLRSEPKSSIPVEIKKNPYFLEGKAKCGQNSEIVRLPELEKIVW
jgi:hypothetical protein